MKRSLFNCAHPFRQRWSIGCLAVALSCASLADEAPPAAAGAETQRLVDINEYVVRGNTVLDNRAIEAAVYPSSDRSAAWATSRGRAMRCRPPTRRRATSRSTSSCRSSR